MYSWVRLGHLKDWCNGKECGQWADLPVKALSTDSRSVKPGEVFLALKGENFDGHDYVEAAVKQGASAVIAERDFSVKVPVLVVKDCLTALIDIGRALRAEFTGAVIGITGSAGKSSTKEMLATLLGPNTVASPASFNNLMGVSRTLCLVQDSTRLLVLEMGMNALGEIAELCETFRPIAGLITNIGDAHMGKLGGREGIYQAKKELFDFLARPHSDAICVALNLDDNMVVKAYHEAFRAPVPTVTYSCEKEADVRLLSRRIDPESGLLEIALQVREEKATFQLPIFGLHQGQNIVAAVAGGLVLGGHFSDFRERIGDIRSASHRGEVKRLKQGQILIDESYNSNPTALKSSLDSVAELSPKLRRVLILGEMFELGEFSEKLHREVGEHLAGLLKNRPAPFVVLGVGKGTQPLLDAVRAGHPSATLENFSTHAEALGWVQSHTRAGDVLFVKGSRGVQLDRLVAKLV